MRNDDNNNGTAPRTEEEERLVRLQTRTLKWIKNHVEKEISLGVFSNKFELSDTDLKWFGEVYLRNGKTHYFENLSYDEIVTEEGAPVKIEGAYFMTLWIGKIALNCDEVEKLNLGDTGLSISIGKKVE